MENVAEENRQNICTIWKATIFFALYDALWLIFVDNHRVLKKVRTKNELKMLLYSQWQSQLAMKTTKNNRPAWNWSLLRFRRQTLMVSPPFPMIMPTEVRGTITSPIERGPTHSAASTTAAAGNDAAELEGSVGCRRRWAIAPWFALAFSTLSDEPEMRKGFCEMFGKRIIKGWKVNKCWSNFICLFMQARIHEASLTCSKITIQLTIWNIWIINKYVN